LRETVRIRGKEVSLKLILALIIVLFLATGIVLALVSIGTVQIGYEITPMPSPPTISPNPISLDLGSIPSGSSGIKDFGTVATLEVPAGYEITFTLDTSTISDFTEFYVNIQLYKPGVGSYLIDLSEEFPSESRLVYAGTYEVKVYVTYTAKNVTTATSGAVIIDISYQGG